MATGSAVKFAYYSGNNVPSVYDNDTIYFLEGSKEIRVGSKLLGNVDENAVSISDLQSVLESYTVKTVEVAGSGEVISGASFDNITGKLTLLTGTLPVLSKGVGSTINKDLKFGDTFEAITGSSVNGHTITDTKTNYTLPTVAAGQGIEVSEGGVVSLPSIFYNYLVEQTYNSPAISYFDVPGLSSVVEVGTDVVISSFSHSETMINNIQGNLTLKKGSTIIADNIVPVTSSSTVTLSSPVTITRNTAGTETLTLSGTTTLGGTISKNVSTSFYLPKFLGASTNTSVTSSEIVNMQKGQTFPTSITISDASYIYFVTDGTISSVKDSDTGFGVPLDPATTLSVNINGVAVAYHVYRTSNSILPGAYTFTIS